MYAFTLLCVFAESMHAVTLLSSPQDPPLDVSEVLTEEQKKQLEDLQQFKNKEGTVSLEVRGSQPPGGEEEEEEQAVTEHGRGGLCSDALPSLGGQSCKNYCEFKHPLLGREAHPTAPGCVVCL